MSSRSIVYKGMLLAESLSDFYPDLKDKILSQDLQFFIKDTLPILSPAGIWHNHSEHWHIMEK